MNFLSPEPLTACRPSDRCFMPSKNVPSPPPTMTKMDNVSFMPPIIRIPCQDSVRKTTERTFSDTILTQI